MKHFFNKHPNLKKQIGIGALIGLLYVAIQHFTFTQYVAFGFMRFISLFIHAQDSADALYVALNYVTEFIYIIITPLILGILLLILRQKYAFRTAFLTTAIAYLLYTLVSLLQLHLQILSLVFMFIAVIIAYLSTLFITRRINKTIIIWVIIVVLGLIDIFALPYITSPIVRAVSQNNAKNALNTAVQSMDFKGYYPTYVPSGLVAIHPELKGYGQASSYENEHIEFKIGKLEFLESKKLGNQDPVLNFTDNCDIGTVFFTTQFKSTISQADVDQSRDNLSICKTIGTTDAGYPVYVKANKSQFIFYFMAVGNTNVVMMHDTENGPRYPANFETEVFKIFNSMKEISPSQYIY